MVMAKQGASTALPRLRFPEFRGTGEWEEKKLDGCLDYQQPTKYLVSETSYNDSYKTPVLTAGKTFILGYTNETRGIFSQGLPVIIFDDFTTASKFVDFPFKAKSSAMKILQAKDGANIKFMYETMQMISYEVGAHERHWISKFAPMPVLVPHPIEQKRIADCLTSLDEVIAAQGRKVQALKIHKRGLMQQLFPRECETQPRLRFPEFRNASEWQRVPLGEIAEIKLGKMLDANKHTSGQLLPYINNISLRWNDVDTSNLPQMYFNEGELERYGLREGDVLVCEGGEPGRSAVWDGRLPDMKFQKAIHRVRFRGPFVPKILVLYMEAIAGTTAFESLFTGGGIKHLTRETFAKLTIPLMSLIEQQRMADCFSSLDTQIAAEANQLAALKTHKQGLMQQLFPAPETAGA